MRKTRRSVIHNHSTKAIHAQLSPKRRETAVTKVLWYNFTFKHRGVVNVKGLAARGPRDNVGPVGLPDFMQHAVKFLGKGFVSIRSALMDSDRYLMRGELFRIRIRRSGRWLIQTGFITGVRGRSSGFIRQRCHFSRCIVLLQKSLDRLQPNTPLLNGKGKRKIGYIVTHFTHGHKRRQPAAAATSITTISAVVSFQRIGGGRRAWVGRGNGGGVRLRH